MRILLTNHHLQHVGGTEKWTYAMARELQRRGHDIEVFTFMKGMTSLKLEEAGIPVVDDPGPKYDLLLVNHATCLVATKNTRGFKIFTSHGPQHPLEMPGPGADAYVGVSEEVRAVQARRGFNLKVIRNGIDLDEFYPTLPIHDGPHVLSMCKIPFAGAMVCQAAQRQGLPFRGVHYLEEPVWDMAPVIQEADIVVACGRSAYEALACGKSVIVFDARSGAGPRADGILTPENIDLIAQCNCSTRYLHKDWSVEDLEEALHQCRPSLWGRDWVTQHANIRTAVDAYLAITPFKEKINGRDQVGYKQQPTARAAAPAARGEVGLPGELVR